MEQNKTSIIILAYKEYKKFAKSILTIIKNTNMEKTPYEIIIVGNNPTTEIDNFIRKELNKFPQIGYIHKLKNVGTSKAFNEGACMADGKYICFFNSDYYMMPNWLVSMIECFNYKKKIGLVSCSTNISGNPVEKIIQTDNDYILEGDYKEADCAIAQMFTTRKIWEEVSGFSEEFFFGFEDLDFNEKIKKKGYKIFVNRRCFGYHDHDPAIKAKDKGHKQLGKSRKIFREKWGNKFPWA